MVFSVILLSILLPGISARAAGLEHNALQMQNSPAWVKSSQVSRVVDRVEATLEWDIRRIRVYWYQDEDRFFKAHALGSHSVVAASRKSDMSMHLGPRVDPSNFEEIFAHELVHIILFQKYGDAIPVWLQEGLANFVGNRGKVDYKWLNNEPLPADIRALGHPFRTGGSTDGGTNSVRRHYMTSRAILEMIASRCDLQQLIQLSVGKKLENYLNTFCGISDLNKDYGKWLKRKALIK